MWFQEGRKCKPLSKGSSIFVSGWFAWNQLWNKGAGEFFGKWLTIVPVHQHPHGTLCQRDGIKTNGGQGRSHERTKGDIVIAHDSNFTCHLSSAISIRTN